MFSVRGCVDDPATPTARAVLDPAQAICDPGLQGLPGAFEYLATPARLGAALAEASGSIHDVRFQLLKHHPGRRCTFEVAFRTAGGWRRLVAKVHASDRSDVYRAMQGIADAGFGPEAELAIPQPVAYVPELCLLLQEQVAGPRAKEVFLSGGERERALAAERCARWLAKFHAAGPRSGPTCEVVSEIGAVVAWCRTVARLGEGLATRARSLGERLIEQVPWPGPTRMRAGHGSYNCNQIVLAGARTVTFDWDGHDVADPARDVARFAVALQRLGLKYRGSIRAFDAEAERFLETYVSGSASRVSWALPWWRGLACLRLAKYEANRPGDPWRDGIVALLDEGIRVLAR